MTEIVTCVHNVVLNGMQSKNIWNIVDRTKSINKTIKRISSRSCICLYACMFYGTEIPKDIFICYRNGSKLFFKIF